MLSNYYTLRLLASTLETTVAGRAIDSLFTQEKDELVVALEGSLHLVVSCRTGENTFFLHPRYARARTNTLSIMPELDGLHVLSAAIDPSDRIVRISLEGGAFLVLRLFGSTSNVLSVDAGGVVRNAFRNRRDELASVLRPPAQEGVHDLVAFRESLSQATAGSLQDITRRHFPELGPVLLREVMFRAGLTPESPVAGLNPDSLDALPSALAGLLAELSRPWPSLYDGDEDSPEVFSPIALRHLRDRTARMFDDIHDAVRHVVYRRRSAAMLREQRSPLLAHLREHLRRSQRAAAALRGTVQGVSRAEEYQATGTLLLSHLQEIPAGARRVELADGGRRVSILLDPRLHPVQNAQAYFDKAKHARSAALKDRRRLSELTRQTELVERLLSDLQQVQTMEDLTRRLNEHAADLQSLGVRAQPGQQERPVFRTFTVDGGFEVWAGRNSANNDLLTFRHARPDDLWFHARGTSGSHVILRVRSAPGEPGKRAREQAASIAAYYSTMRKARLVPVSVTQRKYVRKPRGAHAGTVVIEREKVIFAEPALPPRPHVPAST